MLSTLLLTANNTAADVITDMLEEGGVLKVECRSSQYLSTHEAVRLTKIHDPHVVLVDTNDLKQAAYITQNIRAIPQLRGVIIGFRPSWTQQEEVELQQQGMHSLIAEPFAWKDLEPAVYDAIQRRRTIDHKKFVAFLPAKAGSGCSTVALNTAGALASMSGKKVLLIDGDRRSGIISLLLNITKRNGLLDALRNSGGLSGVEWENHVVRALGMDLLLADPSMAKAALPTWADYHLLLRFVENHYDHVFVDLPELVNPATAEVVRSAGSVFVVCTPELPSMRLAEQRRRELAQWGIPERNIHVLLNRALGENLSLDTTQGLIGQPILATIPNDYSHIHESILHSRLVASHSPFAKGCQQLARQIAGIEPAQQPASRFSFLRTLSLAS